ncbi:MAG: hypothetical protein HMLKMBBP_01976 [Planctomycetes bacterium]|nr:hypothetical protein [Planctomycetota bacterium]
MPRRTELHDALAGLLEYPAEGHAERAAAHAATVVRHLPDAAADLADIVGAAAEGTLGECEEIYVRTFDGNAERALEVGWQVFGEQYERGAFLVELRGKMRAAALPETTELPDHLTNVLRLLARLPEADAKLLVDRAAGRSLARVIENTDETNPYRGVLLAVRRALDEMCPGASDARNAAAAAAGAAAGGIA